MTFVAAFLIAGPSTVAVTSRDWIDWAGFFVTVVGTSLTLIGLYFTFKQVKVAERQASKARGAAEAASAASNSAISAISQRVTIEDLTRLRGAFNAVVTHLAAGNIDVGLFQLRTARESLIELRARAGFEALGPEIQNVVADLAQLQEAIEEKLWSDQKKDLPLPEISKTLSKHADTLAMWSEQHRYSTVERTT